MPHVLIILTSQGLIPATRQQTGWHLVRYVHTYSPKHSTISPRTAHNKENTRSPNSPTHTLSSKGGDAASLALIQNVAAAGKPIAAVSHGPAALLNATAPSGVSLLAGAGVTGFSREEEDAAGMAPALPFQLETELERVSGGGYVKADRSGTKVVVSTTAGLCSPLITGQNPASAAGVAREILRVLGCD
ncbi:hypothetical protein KXW26_003909 [Aspergillus fumigatus]|nr:hypothetical protein KXW26_003909 [Aspergillus fumigatus]